MEPRFVNNTYFFNVCDHIYPLSLPQKHGDLLFVHLNHLKKFVKSALPQINVRFIIVSTMSDSTIPFHYKKDCITIEKNKNIVYWFITNCIQPTKKRQQIPTGLKYSLDQSFVHTADGPIRKIGEYTTNHEASLWQEEEDEIIEIKGSTSLQRINKCYGNFQFMMDTLYGWDRKDAFEQIPKDMIDYQDTRISKKETLMRMKEYKFIVSPFGNGMDCHRTWEALVLGCIPIVKSSGLDPMFKGLPVLIVNSWPEITQELLDSFIPDTSQLDKLTMKYWIECLNSARNFCL